MPASVNTDKLMILKNYLVKFGREVIPPVCVSVCVWWQCHYS